MILKIILYLICTLTGLFLFKSGGGSIQLGLSLSEISFHIPVKSLVGILFYGCSFLIWLTILKDGQISYLFPVVNSLVAIFTVIGGIVFFNEHLTGLQLVGIGVIIAGIFILNINRN